MRVRIFFGLSSKSGLTNWTHNITWCARSFEVTRAFLRLYAKGWQCEITCAKYKEYIWFANLRSRVQEMPSHYPREIMNQMFPSWSKWLIKSQMIQDFAHDTYAKNISCFTKFTMYLYLLVYIKCMACAVCSLVVQTAWLKASLNM
jgi:hypothetical protein